MIESGIDTISEIDLQKGERFFLGTLKIAETFCLVVKAGVIARKGACPASPVSIPLVIDHRPRIA